MEFFVERHGVKHFTGREVEKLCDFHHGLMGDASFMVLKVMQDGQEGAAAFGVSRDEIFFVLRLGLFTEVRLGSLRDLLGAAGFDGP
jgi:hypothetical protein